MEGAFLHALVGAESGPAPLGCSLDVASVDVLAQLNTMLRQHNIPCAQPVRDLNFTIDAENAYVPTQSHWCFVRRRSVEGV